MKSLNDFFDRIYVSLLKQVRPYDKQGAQLWQRRRKLRNEILRFYREHPTEDREIRSSLEYLKKRTDAVYFPSTFRDKYEYRKVFLGFDDADTPYYEMGEGKRLFFMPGEPDKVRMSINNLLIEQDEHSPHRYLKGDFNLGPDDVLADVGSAEGILSLQYVDRVKAVYLFESDPEWVGVLEKTFAPWREKVKIVSKFVSDKDEGEAVRLDTFFEQEGVMPTFVKLDVEGGESCVLQGMKGLLETGKAMKIAACSYHLQDEYAQLKAFAESHGYRYETSEGYMLFDLYDACLAPYFRRGMVRMWVGESGK
jgi:hypothetical protein